MCWRLWALVIVLTPKLLCYCWESNRADVNTLGTNSLKSQRVLLQLFLQQLSCSAYLCLVLVFAIIKAPDDSRSRDTIKGQRQMSAPRRCHVVVRRGRFGSVARQRGRAKHLKYQSHSRSQTQPRIGAGDTLKWFVRWGSCQLLWCAPKVFMTQQICKEPAYLRYPHGLLVFVRRAMAFIRTSYNFGTGRMRFSSSGGPSCFSGMRPVNV